MVVLNFNKRVDKGCYEPGDLSTPVVALLLPALKMTECGGINGRRIKIQLCFVFPCAVWFIYFAPPGWALFKF